MATLQRRRPPPSFPFPDHLLESILVRLPPEDPSCLLRTSLVCKHWRDLIYDPGFLLHLLDLRRAPQMLGFLHDSEYSGGRLEYVPTSPFSFPVPDDASWFLLGYRHGRAVFQSTSAHNLSLLVWVPFTGQRREVLVPAQFEFERFYATVVCAADGCDHRNCYGGPFLIVFVFCDPEGEMPFVSSACVYSSETGTWGEVASTVTGGVCLICDTPAVLVGKSLLYFLSTDGYILEYDLARHSLARIDPPHGHDPDAALYKRMILVQAEADGLGIVLVQPDPDTHGFDDTGCDCLCLLSRKVSEGCDAEWVELGVIYLEESLPYVGDSTSSLCITAFLIGFAEGENTVFVSTRERDDIFTVELQSKRARKVCRCRWIIDRLAPILSSYTSGSALQAPQGEHLSLMAFSSSDETDDDEEAGEEDQAQLLFDKGLKAIEKGCFVAAVDYLSHTLELRVARYGELSPECASTYYQYGRALLKKSRKAAHDFSIVPKSAPYEKTGEGTSSRADTGSSENRDAKEGQNSNTKYQEDIKSESDKDDNEIARIGNDSDLDLAWKMLEVSRKIVEKSKVNSVETFRIVSALTEVSMEKSKRGLL